MFSLGTSDWDWAVRTPQANSHFSVPVKPILYTNRNFYLAFQSSLERTSVFFIHQLPIVWFQEEYVPGCLVIAQFLWFVIKLLPPNHAFPFIQRAPSVLFINIIILILQMRKLGHRDVNAVN